MTGTTALGWVFVSLLLAAATLTVVPAGAFPDAARGEFVSVQGQMERLYREGSALAERTWQAATNTQPSCAAPLRESPMSGVPAPTAELHTGRENRSVAVAVTGATCVAVTVHQRGPDLHRAWDGLLPTVRHARTEWVSTRKSQTLPVTVTAVGPGGTTIITGELAVTAAPHAR